MAYLALYRKYRPDNFDNVVGQKGVVKALQNQVRFGQIGHAYLFCGTRGTGKTTMARVFAKAVNCENPKDGMACGECACCRQSADGMNIIEIDAASNNGVDSVRDLRDEVVYSPIRGKYKVYIIDEAHMLSTAAFNALLKTLEEPPEHAIFILATTEPNKLLPTILSRCQRYDFKRLTAEEIIDRLRYVADKENIEIDDEALETIAGSADGGMRDALSLLDQCACYYIHEPIDAFKVREVLGSVTIEVLADMSRALVAGDGASLIVGVDDLYRTGKDADQFLADWLVFWRAVLLFSALGDKASGYVYLGAAQRSAAKGIAAELASRLSAKEINYYIVALSALANRLRLDSNKRITLEAGLLELRPETQKPEPQKIEAIKPEPVKTEPIKTEAVNTAVRAVPMPAEEAVSKPSKPQPNHEAPKAHPAEQWAFLKNKINDKSKFLGSLLDEVSVTMQDENTLVLHCDDFIRSELEKPKNKSQLSAFLDDLCARHYELIFGDPIKTATVATDTPVVDAAADAAAKLNAIPGIKFE